MLPPHTSSWSNAISVIVSSTSMSSMCGSSANLAHPLISAAWGTLGFFLSAMPCVLAFFAVERYTSLGYAFKEDGLLSSEAIKLIDSGKLKTISKAFGKTVLDMDKEIFAGVFVNDVLDSALKDRKNPNVPQAAEIKGCARLAEDPHMELMEVEETMTEMALDQELVCGGNMA
ncbi:hypothetical protein POM88_014049 [Heracleum sosnowskyi]|uniref:Uncharacterized protein n=1 Tax=Heracleum sosnowskyi TaxID=360622 RepID=A0AAD8J1R8_9APIA|nr:hypothetical protein POM88_014049 [Heracleum sosnowskyi]